MYVSQINIDPAIKKIHQRTASDGFKSTRGGISRQTGQSHRMGKFLMDTHRQTRWSQLTDVNPKTQRNSTLLDLQNELPFTVDQNKKLFEDDQENILGFRKLRFEKKKPFNEAYRILLSNFKRGSQPSSPSEHRNKRRVGLMSEAKLRKAPPLGYYNLDNIDNFKRKVPMLVFMSQKDRSLSQQQITTQTITQDKSETQRSQKKSRVLSQAAKLTQEIQEVPGIRLKFQQDQERLFISEKTKYIPKQIDFDPGCFLTMTQNIDDMKRKLRTMRQEMNQWTDRQVKLFKQNLNDKF